MRILFFLIILFICNICYSQTAVKNDIYILIVNKEKCVLSRRVEGWFRQSNILTFIKQQNYQYVHYYGQNIGLKWHQKWGIKYYPTIIHLKKTKGGYGIKNKIVPKTLSDVLKILGARVQQNKKPPSWSPPGGS